MQIKTKCINCKNQLIISNKDISLNIFMRKGESFKGTLCDNEYKKGNWCSNGEVRYSRHHYKLLEDIELKSCRCLCGEIHYLRNVDLEFKSDIEWILENYQTELIKTEKTEWESI